MNKIESKSKAGDNLGRLRAVAQTDYEKELCKMLPWLTWTSRQEVAPQEFMAHAISGAMKEIIEAREKELGLAKKQKIRSSAIDLVESLTDSR